MRKFSPDPDLAEQCLVHGQLKQRAMGFCWDAAMSINVLYGALQIVPFLPRLSRLDLKEEKSHKRPSSSPLFSAFSCTVSPSFRVFSDFSFCLSLPTFYSHFFASTFFQPYMIADGIKHQLGLSSSACFPHSHFALFSLSLYWLVTSHDSWHIYFRCYPTHQQKNR